MKKGTTAGTGHQMKKASMTGVRHGPSHKNVSNTAKPKAVGGSAVVGPIKGMDKGGL